MDLEKQDEKLLNGLCSLFTEAESYFQTNNDLLASLKNIKAPYSEKTFFDQGGMKNIYTCKDLRSDRIIAMAEINDFSDAQKLNDFLREAKITAYLQHPNIVPVYEIGLNDNDIPFFTMKLIKGQNLGEILRALKNGDKEAVKKFPLSKLIDIFEKVCDGIAYAHSKGVLHLDIKPDNISVSSYGEVLVCDWGISELCPEAFDNEAIMKEEFKSLLPLLRSDNIIRGTLPFISPEQVNKEVGTISPLSDIYSLGVLLYSILTFDIPFKHTDQKGDLLAVLKGDFLNPSQKSPDKKIPKSLEAICLKAMFYSPKERYKNVGEILTELHRFKHGFATEAEDATALELLSLLYKRNKQTCIAIIAAFLTIAITITLSINGIRKNEQIAIAERNNALVAKNKTMELINELKSEQLQKLNMSSKAAEKYLQNIKNMLYFKNFGKADETIKTIWELGSHDFKYQKFYGWYQVALLNFDVAINILKKLPEEKDNIKVLKAAQMTLSIDTVQQIAGILSQDIKERNLAGYFLRNCISENFTLKEQMKILKLEMANYTNKDINFNFELLEEGVTLNISDTEISYPGSLDKFDIIELDISNTTIIRTDRINWQTLRVLKMSSSRVKALDSAPNLSWLDISNSEIKDFSKFKTFKNLEYIDIRGIEKFPVKLLNALPKLKTVVLDRSQAIKKKVNFEVIYR